MKKKILTGVLALALVCCCLLGAIPVAAAGVSVRVEMTPSELTQAGNVALEVIVENGTSERIEDVQISDSTGKNLGTIPYIEPNGTESIDVENYAISDSMLDQTITFTARWDGGEASGTGRVTRREITPNLEFSRGVDKRVVSEGSTVTFTYNLENVGEVDLSNITVTDTAFGSSPVRSGISLRRQSSGSDYRFSFTQTLTVTESVTSTPTVTFTANGRTYTQELASLTITVADAGINVSVSADKREAEVGETVTVTCELENVGNVDISNITLRDELGTVIRNGISLRAGASTTVRTTYVAEEKRNIVITATGTDSSGNSVTGRSSGFSVDITEAEPSSDGFNVSIIAVPSRTSLTEPGEVEFTITVINSSGFDLRNLVLSEDTIGRIGQISTLEDGAEEEFTETFEVEETTDFIFRLTCTDADGTEYEETSTLLTVAVGEDAMLSPTPSGIPVERGDTTSTLLIILIVIIALIVICGIVFFVLIAQEKKAKKIAAENARRKKLAQQGGNPNALGGQEPPLNQKVPPNQVIEDDTEPASPPPLMEEEEATMVEFGPDGKEITKEEEQDDAVQPETEQPEEGQIEDGAPEEEDKNRPEE